MPADETDAMMMVGRRISWIASPGSGGPFRCQISVLCARQPLSIIIDMVSMPDSLPALATKACRKQVRVLEEGTIDTANEGVAWEGGLESFVYVR